MVANVQQALGSESFTLSVQTKITHSNLQVNSAIYNKMLLIMWSKCQWSTAKFMGIEQYYNTIQNLFVLDTKLSSPNGG